MPHLARNDRRQYLLGKIVDSQAGLDFDFRAPRVALNVAGVRLDLVTRDARLGERLRRYFAAYEGRGTADAELRLEPLAATADFADVWEDEDAEFHVSADGVVQRDFVARRLPRSKARADRAVALVNGDVDDAFHNLLRWFLPRVFLGRGAFLLHGAGVARQGRGYVFFGQSGAGKSTCASLIHASDESVTLLGDDAVIIQVTDDGSAFLHSAPLGCGYARSAPEPLSVPLAGLYNLRQATDDRIEPLTASQGVAALLASAMNTTPADDLAARFDLAHEFARASCRIHALHFTPDPAFWPLVLKHRRSSDVSKTPALEARL